MPLSFRSALKISHPAQVYYFFVCLKSKKAMGSPAFQFYPDSWLGSFKVLMMKPEYEGGYIRLLCYMWNDEDCSLPDDDEVLASLSRLNERWFSGGSAMVRKCFVKHPNKDGFLTNNRLQKEREKQIKWRDKSKQAGIESGKKRRQKAKKKENEPTFNQIVTNPEPTLNIQSLSLSPSINSEIKEINKENPPKVGTPKLSIDERKNNFKESLKPFKEKYGVEMLKDFYEYWTEVSQNGLKIKKEFEQTFEVGKRLDRWSKNNSKFQPNGQQPKQEPQIWNQ